MANTIGLADKYVKLLDEKYVQEIKTEGIEADPSIVQETMSAKNFFLPSTKVSGLGDYDRNNGFQKGNVEVSWESHTFEMDRGTQFEIDEADNMETVEIAFASASGEFIRTEVAPEVDAYRFATMAGKADTDNVVKEDIDATNVIEGIDKAIEALDNAEVPESGRTLYVNPTVYRYLKQSDLISRNYNVQSGEGNVSREVMTFEGMELVKVPKSRFNTGFNALQIDGTNDGGFELTGEDINFMIVHEDAILPIVKLDGLRVFSPEENQDSRKWKFDYRLYHTLVVPANKTKGIYVNQVPSA